MFLDAGNDVYDGTHGTATGGVIKLGAGNDSAFGGAGTEIFAGDEGNDLIHGGGGADTVDYSDATGGVKVDLGRTRSRRSAAGRAAIPSSTSRT